MDNRDFWPYIRAAKLPEFNSSLISSTSTEPPTFYSWLLRHLRSFYRYCYVYLHDLILSSLFGYLTLNEKLYVTIHENNLFKARELLARGASPSYIPVDYKSIFTHLIRNNKEIQNYYIETSLFASILANDSMLYMAVSNNNFHLVKELIQYHNYGQINQHTEVVSLCLAVKRCYVNIVEYLIDFGNINPNDCVQIDCKHCKTHADDIQRYQFPLYHACRENHFNLVKYLIESKGCDINQLTNSYETSLHGAIVGAIENRFDSSYNNQQRYNIIKYLLTRNDCRLDIGLNPLCISLVDDTVYDYTNLLLQFHCDVNRLGWNRFEINTSNLSNNRKRISSSYLLDHPLNICLRRLCQSNENIIVADQYSHKQYALALIKHGANIYAMYDQGLTYPFLLAVQTGDKLIVENILNEARNYLQWNIIEPLICACTKSYYDIVQILVDAGFNPNTTMINREISTVTIPVINSSDFLQSLNRYCTYPSTSISTSSCSSMNSEQQLTAFLALSRMSTWIFHPDKYFSTIRTIENLFSRIPIDFTIRSNRLAFYNALLNEHMPIVYFCLANFSPIYIPFHTIDFTQFSMKNHFSYTLFHLISLCSRLTTNHRITRILFDSYAKTILRIQTYDRNSSMKNVLAYMKLWFDDEDFLFDETLFEHLMSLPYIDDIIEVYGEKKLKSMFGNNIQRIIERQSRLKPMYPLKHLCRLKIRQYSQTICSYRQTNLLEILSQFDYLPKTLQAYLFYSNSQSKSLINCLLNRIPWNYIQWM